MEILIQDIFHIHVILDSWHSSTEQIKNRNTWKWNWIHFHKKLNNSKLRSFEFNLPQTISFKIEKNSELKKKQEKINSLSFFFSRHF
jgi:hypothetical protein